MTCRRSSAPFPSRRRSTKSGSPANSVNGATPSRTASRTTTAWISALPRGRFGRPPELGPLFGGEAGTQTLGGVVACNLSGPRRIKAGAARDHLLGLHAVSGRGEAFKTGGRVVKNVTGYDVCKLMTGAFGTLGAFTDLTFKVLPAPEASLTVILSGLTDREAVRALTEALQSPYDVSGAAHLPTPVAAGLAGAESDVALTVMRLEGFSASVTARAKGLAAALAGIGQTRSVADGDSEALWRQIRDVSPFAGAGDAGRGALEDPGSVRS